MEWADFRYFCCKIFKNDYTPKCRTKEYLVCDHQSAIAGSSIGRKTTSHLSAAALKYLLSPDLISCIDADLKEITGCKIQIRSNLVDQKPLEDIHLVNIWKGSIIYTLQLHCSYEEGATFQWLNGEQEVISNRSHLVYEVSKNEPEKWQTFANKGMIFTCSIPSTNQSQSINVSGLPTVDYGTKRMLSCGNDSANYSWTLNGKLNDKKYKNNEVFTFDYKQSRKVIIECFDVQNTLVKTFALVMCARELFQQYLSIAILFLTVGLISLFILVQFFCFSYNNWRTKTYKISQERAKGFGKRKENNEGGEHNVCSFKGNKNKYDQAFLTHSIVRQAQTTEIEKNCASLNLAFTFSITMISMLYFLLDMTMDCIAFTSNLYSADVYLSGLGMALIVAGSTMTSLIILHGIFSEEFEPSSCFEQLTNNTYMQSFTFFAITLNFGPVLVHFQLLHSLCQVWKSRKTPQTMMNIWNTKCKPVTDLIVKIHITEFLCETLGQIILQGYILTKQLEMSTICLPDQETFQPSTNLQESWIGLTFSQFVEGASEGLGGKTSCTCSNWVTRGLLHCYPDDILEKSIEISSTLEEVKCFVAECSSSIWRWSSIFPLAQILLSLIQISFTMTLIGVVKGLKHVISLKTAWKKFLFVFITFLYFLTSIATSLLLSAYLANKKDRSYWFLGLLLLFRLIFPETVATERLKRKHKWIRFLVRLLSLLLPLLAHLPLYFLLYVDLAKEESGCEISSKNDITLHLLQRKIFNHSIVSYLATSPQVISTLTHQLSKLPVFPVNFYADNAEKLLGEQKLPTSSNETVMVIRHTSNIFDHFFLWTGWLVLADAIITITFLAYWFFVVKPQVIVSHQLTCDTLQYSTFIKRQRSDNEVSSSTTDTIDDMAEISHAESLNISNVSNEFFEALAESIDKDTCVCKFIPKSQHIRQRNRFNYEENADQTFITHL